MQSFVSLHKASAGSPAMDVACSDTLLQSKRFRITSSTRDNAAGAALLLLELELRLRQRRRINPSLAIRRPHRKPLREPVMNSSVPGTEVVKTPTPHKANMKEEWGNFRCLPVSFAFIELSLSLCLCLFLVCRLQWLPHATLANQWHGTDYSIPYSVFGLRFA